MNLQNHKLTILALMIFVFMGTGCVSQPVPVSDGSLSDNAEALDLKVGSEIVLNQTVLGLGGMLVDFLGGETESRHITINEWTPGKSAKLSWKIDSKVETDGSLKARADYDDEFKETPIGVVVPKKPEAVFNTITKKGELSTSAFDIGEIVSLPAYWQDAEVMAYTDSTLIWISDKQYDELVNKRKSVLNLGLFDDQLAFAAGFTDTIKNLLNKLKQESEEATDKEDILSVTANEQWGSYELKVDGKYQKVRTIEAQNWFGRYTILANPENPLILEIVLSPVSRGSFNVFTKEKLLESFLGYEVTEVNSK